MRPKKKATATTLAALARVERQKIAGVLSAAGVKPLKTSKVGKSLIHYYPQTAALAVLRKSEPAQITAARDRKARATATMMRLRDALMDGRALRGSLYLAKWLQRQHEVQSQLAGIPGRLADRVAALNASGLDEKSRRKAMRALLADTFRYCEETLRSAVSWRN